MRIPISITIPACIFMAVFVFWLGSKDKDYMKPPTPERLAEISKEWEKKRPNIPPPKPINAALLADPTPIIPKFPSLPLGDKGQLISSEDLFTAPALAEYGTLGDKGAGAIIQLATFLTNKAEYQRALLAWERVLDTANPDTEQRKTTILAIQQLRNSLPPWNPDSMTDINITLHAKTSLKDNEALIKALRTTAGIITEASGNTLKVATQTSFIQETELKPPPTPITIWFSHTVSKKENITAETHPISFMLDPEQPEALGAQLTGAVYSLLRSYLISKTNFTHLPASPIEIVAENILKQHVTRLMWREFALNIQP